MRWKIATVVVLSAMVFAGRIASARVGLPSGERQLGKTIIEPAYDDSTGSLVYLQTPIGAPFPSKANAKAVSPLYLVVYPNSAAGAVGTMNCAHQPSDNCPDHGPGISNFAASQYAFYGPLDGSGVWGHDHLVDAPGGSEFNVAWQVHVVLFTNEPASHTHITTDAQVDQFLTSGDAVDFLDVTFNCNVVSEATYNRAIPLPPALLPSPALHRP